MKVFERIQVATKKDGFSVLQFNCLASSYAGSDARGFRFVDPKCLDWQYRYPRLLEEINNHKSDIITLEEIDHYEKFKNDIEGYESVFSEKKKSIHGISVFWNPEKFEVLKFEERQFPREDQVAMVFLFNFLPLNEKLVFLSTHLKAKPGNEKIRLEQVKKLAGYVGEFSHEEEDQIPAVVIAGDFNDISTSPMYEFLVKKEGFNSSYGNFKEPWTTYKKRKEVVCRTIDYIFFKNLKVDGLLDVPKKEEFKDRLPALDYPSDHLAIKASFSFLEEDEED